MRLEMKADYIKCNSCIFHPICMGNEERCKGYKNKEDRPKKKPYQPLQQLPCYDIPLRND